MSAPTFLQVLKAEVARMQTLHPEREGEIARATALILNGMVLPSADDPETGQVLSSDGTKSYRVNGTCDCTAGQHGKECKHRQSWRLYQYIERKVAAVEPQALPTPALPEARCSLNAHLLIDGTQVQITLRGHDEREVLARLKAVLAEYPQRKADEARPSQDECPLHHVPMQRNTKNGRSWLSHRTTQGWCKGGER